MSPIKSKMCLPLDCSDLLDFEWEELKPAQPNRSFADFKKNVQSRRSSARAD